MVGISVSFSELTKQGQNQNELTILRRLGEGEKFGPEGIFQAGQGVIRQGKQEGVPICAICLEQVSTFSISILCGHYFHCQCLERWEFNTCPLCRYHQHPPIIKFCEMCSQCEGLWVCLVCGVRLCGGADGDILGSQSHIYLHYKQSNHSLAMQLETKFLFDARVPAFLHQMFYKQLIQKGVSEKIGKGPIEGMNQSESSQLTKQSLKKNKLSDKISLYENQVAEQMHKQRSYFQEAISEQSKKHRQIIHKKKDKMQALQRQLNQIEVRLKDIDGQAKKVAQQVERWQKEQKVLGGLQKMCIQKINHGKEGRQKNVGLQRKRLQQLQQMIEEKKQQLLNYKANLDLQVRLKQKLKGQTVEGELFLMGDSKGRKSKKK